MKYTSKKIVMEIVLLQLRVIESRFNHWYKYTDSEWLNGVWVGEVEHALRILSICKNGYDWVVPEFKLEERQEMPHIQYQGRDISLDTLCDMFKVDYYRCIKSDL